MPELRWVDIDVLDPNPWNPNRMDPEMYKKAIASIREFGFVDPVTVRQAAEERFEIIDGEHRWKAAREEGFLQLPVFDLGEVEDDVARQLTIVLNETRGQADPRRLGELLRDLASRNSKERLLAALPFNKSVFDQLTGLSTIDFSDMDLKPQRQVTIGWVERVYRMPKDTAEIIDRAIDKFRIEEDDRLPEWKVLELLASDFLASGG